MTYAFTCCATTHIGNRRKNNEDNFFITEILSPEEQNSMSQTGSKVIQKNVYSDGTVNRIYAVSDGMGGHKMGKSQALWLWKQSGVLQKSIKQELVSDVRRSLTTYKHFSR